MIPAYVAILEKALEEMKLAPKTRASSLAVTKLEEALFWAKEAMGGK